MPKPKLLLADHSIEILQTITNAPLATKYQIETVRTGPECLSKIHEFKPDLIYMDMMLPQMHSIEILKKIKEEPELSKIGVIIGSFQIMIQNYHSAIDNRANYFLEKPFYPDFFFSLVEKFFQGSLEPVPFALHHASESDILSCYNPIASTHSSYIRFWGTRGSNPVSGPEYVKHGGNTCSLEVTYEGETVIIDAGTGIRQLGETLDGKDKINLFIGHTHWDHITGIPFFKPLYQKNCDVTIWSPVGFEQSTKKLFSNMLAYAYFPVRLDEMHSKLSFKELRDSKPIHIGKITIETHYTNHPGPTFGFKITTPSKKIGYITDNEMLIGFHGNPNEITLDHPKLKPHLDLIEFLKDCDTVIHEAQYFPSEYHTKVGWGHSSIPNATALIKHLSCKEWIVTHHDPAHKDYDLQVKNQVHQDVLKECNIDCLFQLAYDGLIIPI